MAYIGQRPVVGRYIKLDQISSGFNGSNTDFNMTAGSQAVFPGTARNLLLSLGGVIQEPDTDFTISGSTLTFTTPPVSNTTFFGVIYGDMQSIGTPSDGTVLPISIASSGNFTFPEITLTGDLTIPDKLIHSGDTNTSIRFPAADTFTVETAGSEAVRITDDQKILFGSTVKRNVGGSSTLSVFQIEGVNTNRSSISLINNQSSAAAASLRFGKTKGISVGAVDAVTNNDNLGQIRFCGSDGTDIENTTAMIIGIVDGSVSSNTVPTAISFETSATNSSSRAERMRITSAGNVGINTTSPNALLDINGSSAYTVDESGRADQGLDIQATAGGNGNFGGAISLGSSGTGRAAIAALQDNADADRVGLVFITHDSNTAADDAVEKMRLTATGLLGIGTTSPDVDLHISGASSIAKIESTASANSARLIIKSANDTYTGVHFGDDADDDVGRIRYYHADNHMHFSTGASERLRIDSAGKVGVGTTSPGAKLTVVGTSGAITGQFIQGADTVSDRTIIAQGTSGNNLGAFVDGSNVRHLVSGQNDILTTDGGNYLALHTSSGTERVRIDSTGKVGIGTSSPSQLMELASTAPNIRLTDTIDGHSELDGNAASLRLIADKGNAKADTTITFLVDNSEKMRIDSSGRVGIGTTSPGAELNVSALGASDEPTIKIASENSSIFLRTAGSSGSFPTGGGGDDGELTYLGGDFRLGIGTASKNLIFFNGSGYTERMRIDDAGALCIGTNVANGAGTRITAVHNDSMVHLTKTSTGNKSNIVLVNERATGSTKGNAIIFRNAAGSSVGTVRITNTGTEFNEQSDYRLKENVVPISDGITRLKALKPSRFNFIADATKTFDGFLAHEVTPAVPEAVSGEKDAVITQALIDSGDAPDGEIGDLIPQEIDKSKIVPLLTAALQEAVAKIETLETKVAALEAA